MSFDVNLLVTRLMQDAALAALSDDQIAAQLSTPAWQPRTGRITLTTLAAADVSGFAKAAAAQAAFEQVAASGGASGAQAASLLAILKGPGFDATDPQVAALAPTFVAMAPGVLSSADGQIAVNAPSYAVGGPLAAGDVTAARPIVAARIASQNKRIEIAAGYNAAVALCDQYDAAAAQNPATAVAPTAAQLQQAFSSQVTQ